MYPIMQRKHVNLTSNNIVIRRSIIFYYETVKCVDFRAILCSGGKTTGGTARRESSSINRRSLARHYILPAKRPRGKIVNKKDTHEVAGDRSIFQPESSQTRDPVSSASNILYLTRSF